VPVSRLADLGPPATFVVLNRQLPPLRVELLVAYVSFIALLHELGVAAVGFLKT
jgi:hypothetical protein